MKQGEWSEAEEEVRHAVPDAVFNADFFDKAHKLRHLGTTDAEITPDTRLRIEMNGEVATFKVSSPVDLDLPGWELLP